MSKYKNSQYVRQEVLIESSEIFSGDKGNGYFKGAPRPFILRDGMNNLYEPIREGVVKYFKDNNISWWGGNTPSGHTLSSQIACLNHLFAIMNDKEAVLAMLNGVRNEFMDVLPVNVMQSLNISVLRWYLPRIISTRNLLREDQTVPLWMHLYMQYIEAMRRDG